MSASFAASTPMCCWPCVPIIFRIAYVHCDRRTALRSDEDWRTLFDTLYEQEREEAKNAAASSGSHRNNDVPSAMPNYVVSMSR